MRLSLPEHETAEDLKIREHAPTRAEVEAVRDVVVLREMQAAAEDNVISLETQLEFLGGDFNFRSRRVGALINWRQAANHIKRHRADMHRVNRTKLEDAG